MGSPRACLTWQNLPSAAHSLALKVGTPLEHCRMQLGQFCSNKEYKKMGQISNPPLERHGMAMMLPIMLRVSLASFFAFQHHSHVTESYLA